MDIDVKYAREHGILQMPNSRAIIFGPTVLAKFEHVEVAAPEGIYHVLIKKSAQASNA